MTGKKSATIRFSQAALLALLLLTAASSRAADTGTPEQAPAIRIRIYDYAAIPASMLQRAAGRAERIFSPAGIELQWLRCRTSMDDLSPGDSACSAPVGPTDIIVRLLTEKMARKLARQSNCAGYAIHTKDGLGAKAGVYIHRVTELERQSNAPRHAILGIFLAHEIGHLMLPDGRHSRDGVMRASWSPEVLLRAVYGQAAFTPKQTRQIQRNAKLRSTLTSR